MSDVLARICATTRESVAKAKRERPLAALEQAARTTSPPRGFIAALEAAVAQGRDGLIAEIKKASPSKGLIRADFDPVALAEAYRSGGATCLSVLTDEVYFQGRPEYLAAAREASGLPVLRKDFMLDPYQIVESRVLGADCVLLIMAALTDEEARGLESLAHANGMDVLVEVHNRDELERALKLKTTLLGVNNRNLKTLSVDLNVTEELSTAVPSDRILVCESGLRTRSDLDRMNKVGAHCFLVGEALMAQQDVTAATRALLGGSGSAAAGSRARA
jgi:indole-3-glycerol phosphate synthase